MARANSVRRPLPQNTRVASPHSPSQSTGLGVHKFPISQLARAFGDGISVAKAARSARGLWSATRLRNATCGRTATLLSEIRMATFLCLLFLATTATASPTNHSLVTSPRSGTSPFASTTAGGERYILAGNSIEEIWQKSQSLRPEPSMDTTPVTAKVGDITYSIPRNYIWKVFDFPVLKVTYPGFKPLTEETRGCFDAKLRDGLGCTTLELHLRLSLPHHPGFENLIRLAKRDGDGKPLSRSGPDRYEIYDLGPENARTEIYRNEAEDIFFTCKTFDNHGVRDAVCDDAVPLPDGNAVWFFFGLRQISELRNFEAGIQQLMSNFRTGEKQ
jgi:hypothetical protein